MNKKVSFKLFVKILFQLLYLTLTAMVPLLIGFIVLKNDGIIYIANCFFVIAGLIYFFGIAFIIVRLIYTNRSNTSIKEENIKK